MRSGKYRINSSTIALFLDESLRTTAVTVPAGSIITINLENLASNALIDVMWEGKEVQMFAQDVRTRGEKID